MNKVTVEYTVELNQLINKSIVVLLFSLWQSKADWLLEPILSRICYYNVTIKSKSGCTIKQYSLLDIYRQIK